jgi:protein-S-isoprenylcysteine O-methyltransferase Ste14
MSDANVTTSAQIRRDVRAIVLLPGVVTVLIPALLVWAGGANFGWWSAIGALVLAAGLVLFAWTVRLFVQIGRGTLAPWDPTRHLVVEGPYRYVRNPMITAVLTILIGEALTLGNPWIAVEAATVFTINAIYFPLSEEPGLKRRFGAEYDEYARNVPRWIPRLRSWD